MCDGVKIEELPIEGLYRLLSITQSESESLTHSLTAYITVAARKTSRFLNMRRSTRMRTLFRHKSLLLLLAFTSRFACGSAFVPLHSRHFDISLAAKKKSNRAKGFGKVEPPAPPAKKAVATQQLQQQASDSQQQQSPNFLQSVEKGSTATPVVEDESSSSSSPEERAAAVLRDKYGLKTLEEQQMSAKQLEARKEQAKKLSEWKRKAELNEPLDIMTMLPAPVLIAIDRFLKAGVAICTTLFVLGGFAITLEAWSKTSESPLPENIDNFIVTVVEPNFTPGLLVLLGFSVSLGVFAALQMGSEGSTYKED